MVWKSWELTAAVVKVRTRRVESPLRRGLKPDWSRSHSDERPDTRSINLTSRRLRLDKIHQDTQRRKRELPSTANCSPGSNVRSPSRIYVASALVEIRPRLEGTLFEDDLYRLIFFGGTENGVQ